MSLGLVAYGSSDESDNDEEMDVQPEVQKTANAVQPQVEKTDNAAQQNNSSNLKKLHLKDEGISDDEEEEEHLNFTALPEPVHSTKDENIAEADTLPLPKKVNYGSIEKPPKKAKGPAKIVIPSLSNFEEEDAPEGSHVKKAPSKKGSGLIGMLPPPKSSISLTKVNSLVPNAVSRKPVETKMTPRAPISQSTKAVQKENSTQVKPKSTLQSISNDHSDSEDDDESVSFKKKPQESGGMDFFSLSTPTKIPDHLLPPADSVNLDDILGPRKKFNDEKNLPKETKPAMKLSSNVMNLPREEILLKNKAEVGPKLPVPEQEYHVDSQGNVAFDDKAIEYLCGRRGVKRKNEFEKMDIMEISGEDMKPDERDWLVKALTEEQVHRPISVGAGPSGQSKKKHQITYLAHQAKAMELELKNQWAANKATKQQSRAKYGF